MVDIDFAEYRRANERRTVRRNVSLLGLRKYDCCGFWDNGGTGIDIRYNDVDEFIRTRPSHPALTVRLKENNIIGVCYDGKFRGDERIF